MYVKWEIEHHCHLSAEAEELVMVQTRIVSSVMIYFGAKGSMARWDLVRIKRVKKRGGRRNQGDRVKVVEAADAVEVDEGDDRED